MPTQGTPLFEDLEDGGLEVSLKYLYADDAYWEKYELACKHLMWLRTTLVSQLINSFIALHWEYYAECAELDAKARELSVQDFFDECCNFEAELTPYIKERPTFKPSPLDSIIDFESSSAYRRRVRTIRIGRANGALLRMVSVVDRASLTVVVSRVLRWHFDRYWEKLYVPQIRAAEAKSFRRLFSKPQE